MHIVDLIVFLVCTGGIVLMGILFYKRETSARKFTNAGRNIPGWVVGMLGIIVALALVNVDSILGAWWKLSSIFSGGMLGLFLLGYISRRARAVHALCGVLSGLLVIAWISAWHWLGLPDPGLHEYLAIVLGTTTIFVVGFTLSLVMARK